MPDTGELLEEPARTPRAAKSLPWYEDGLRFECTRCGNCCTGEPGTVRVELAEVDSMARHLGLTRERFVAEHVRRLAGGVLSLRERADGECVLYDRARGCTVYAQRPRQCRTWPFWRDVVETPASWREAGQRCPGIGHGFLHARESIEELSCRDGTLNGERGGG